MKKIAIIEDYAPLARLMADFLRAKGHQISIAITAVEGLRHLIETRPDIALVDLALGDETGLEVMRRAKASGCKAKFIFVTGCNEVRTAVEVVKAGAEDYLTKPFKLENLADAVDECFETAEPPPAPTQTTAAARAATLTRSTLPAQPPAHVSRSIPIPPPLPAQLPAAATKLEPFRPGTINTRPTPTPIPPRPIDIPAPANNFASTVAADYQNSETTNRPATRVLLFGRDRRVPEPAR